MTKKTKNIKQKEYCFTNSIKTEKIVNYQKKKKKREGDRISPYSLSIASPITQW